MSLFNGREWADFSFEERLAIKIMAESSFLNFARIFFEITQGEPLLINWHHRWFAEEADKRIRGDENSSLAIAVPPGSTKTEFFSIFIHAYTLALIRGGKLKRFRNLALSSGRALVERNSKRVRDIVNCEEFQELWPCQFTVSQAEEWIVVDEKGRAIGTMVSKPMMGQVIGSRGGYPGPEYSGAIIIDDGDKAEDLFSSVRRERSHRILTNTVRSRRGDKSKAHPTPVFMIQQRLHKDDSIGYCLSGGMGIDFKSVVIPALITDEFIDTLPDHIREFALEDTKDSPRVTLRINESGTIARSDEKSREVTFFSFWEQMEGVDQLVVLWEKDEYTFMSQYMQMPISMSGNLIDSSWFPRYTQIPSLILDAAIYVDTNSGKVKDSNDYTVFTLALKSDHGVYIAAINRGKWDPLDLLTQAKKCWDEWSAAIPAVMKFKIKYLAVEDKQAGQGLIQTLKTEKRIPLQEQQRGAEQNKFARHCNTYPTLKQGKVYIPSTFDIDGRPIKHTAWYNGDKAYPVDWVEDFIDELDGITVGVLMDQESGFDDQYDTLMDAVQDLVIDGQRASASSLAYRRRR